MISHTRVKRKSKQVKDVAGSGKRGTQRRAPSATGGTGRLYPAGPRHRLAPTVQTQLTVGPVYDPYEREADVVANRVIASPSPAGPIQRQSAEDEPAQTTPIRRQAVEEEPVQPFPIRRQPQEEEPVQRQPMEEEEPVQRQPEEETLQPFSIRRQPQEEEPVQRQVEEEEPVQRQPEEETVQAFSVRRQPQEEEPVQRQAEEEEPVQRRPAEEEAVQPLSIRRQAMEEEEPVLRQAEEEPVQPFLIWRQAATEDEPIQRTADGRPHVSSNTASTIRRPGAGQPLQPRVRHHIEPHVGADLSSVRVHSDADAGRAAASLGARAFTHRNHIFLGGRESSSDLELMAHEATHVVQQEAASVHTAPTVQRFSIDDLPGVDAADLARRIPGYTLFTVVIGHNPLTNTDVEPTAINLIQGLMELVPFGADIFDALNERGILQDAYAWVQGRLSDLDLSMARVGRVLDRAWERIDLVPPFSMSENLDKVVEEFEPLYDDAVTFARSLVDHIMEMIKEAALDLAEEFLEENEAWDLIKKILGEDPLRDEPVDATPAEILEDFLLLIGKEEEVRQMKEKGTLEETANWLATQIATFNSLLTELGGLIDRAWDAIQPANLPDLPDNLRQLAADVGGFLQRVWDFASTVAAKVLELIKNALLSWLSDFAHEVPGFHLITVLIGRNPFTGEQVPRTAENIIRGFITLLPGGNETYQQLAETGTIAQAAARIEGAMSELGISWEFVVGLFTDIWESLTIDDLIDPIGAFTRIRDQFGEPISRLFAFISVVVREIFMILLEMMNFPTDLIASIISNAMQAFESIKNDPVGFLLNMLRAVKLGFSNFFDNILQHLVGGLADWLFRGLRDAGIEPPTDLSLASILDLVLQVLGLTMDRIWEKLAERVGQETVDRIRGAIDRLTGIWNFVKDVQERGIVAIWEYIESQISSLWDMILEKAQEWVMERIINRAIQWLLSLLDPTGIMPVINSFMAFFNAVQSAIEYMRDILAIVNDYVTTIAAVARGDVQPGAEKMEQGLANAIPIAIGFLANQFGLGNIAEKVQEIIAGIREVVDRALDWLLDRAVNAVQSLLRAIGVGGDVEEEEEAEDGGEMEAATAQQVAEAMASIPAREASLVSEGKLSRAEAEQVAEEVRQSYPVFQVFTVVDGGDSWNYHYEVNPDGEVDEDRPQKAEGDPPETRLRPQPSGGKANTVDVRPLSKDAESKGNSNTTAATPGDEELTILNNALPGRSTNWVKLHLIHFRLGGPNSSWNLIPGTIAANNNMRDWAEQPAISHLYDSEDRVMWYRTTVLAYHDDPFDSFVKELKVEYGDYDPATDTELTKVTPANIESTDPAEQYPDMPTANINQAGRVVLARVGSLEPEEARAIAHETTYFGPFTSMRDMEERLSARDEFGPDDIEWLKELLRKGFFVGIPTVRPEWQRG